MPQTGTPQLRMWLELKRELSLPPLARGYEMRVVSRDDLSDWVAVLNSTGDLGAWTTDRAVGAMSVDGHSRVLEDGVHIVYHGREPAATACLTVHLSSVEEAELGWVAVHPKHRKLGLGRLVCAAVLEDMRVRGCRRAFLLTDDHRVAAINLYWSLGFRPSLTHISHSVRWEGLKKQLHLVDSAV